MALVRYYIPFDKDEAFVAYIKQKMIDGDVIIIDKVDDESKRLSGGLIKKKLNFLNDKDFIKAANYPYNTSRLIPIKPKTFENMMNNQFVVQIQKDKLTDIEFEQQKDEFYKDADVKQVLMCWEQNQKGNDYILVTEETPTNNDNKLFRKIPFICKELKIKTKTLPQLIKIFEKVDFEIKVEK
ncbi:MAG: DUF4411 family protein [Firmicutes bacterium]|nr:DUF4411 family protein [Bacillota bacterium]